MTILLFSIMFYIFFEFAFHILNALRKFKNDCEYRDAVYCKIPIIKLDIYDITMFLISTVFLSNGLLTLLYLFIIGEKIVSNTNYIIDSHDYIYIKYSLLPLFVAGIFFLHNPFYYLDTCGVIVVKGLSLGIFALKYKSVEIQWD